MSNLQVGSIPEPQAEAARLVDVLPQDVSPPCPLHPPRWSHRTHHIADPPPSSYPTYHRLYFLRHLLPTRCESCIERLFTLGPAPCPTCSVIVRKSSFKIQTFEDLRVEEEVAVRRRIAKK